MNVLKNNLNVEILKNPLAVLMSEDVLSVLKKHWIGNHQNLTDPGKFVEEFFAFLRKDSLRHQMSKSEILRFYEIKLKEYKSGNIPKPENADMFYEMIKPELLGVRTLLDFGCGKLTFLKNIALQDKNIEKFIGVDAKSNPASDNSDERIKFKRNLDNIPESSVDLAVVKLVLHHLEEKETLEILRRIKSVLKPTGKLVVFEESFPENDMTTWTFDVQVEQSEATEDFLKLEKEDKIKFLFLNDWLMNLQNDYMPWTLQYRSMEKWKRLIESAGFQEKEAHFLGAVKNRKRKQGMTAVITFQN